MPVSVWCPLLTMSRTRYSVCGGNCSGFAGRGAASLASLAAGLASSTLAVGFAAGDSGLTFLGGGLFSPIDKCDRDGGQRVCR